MKYIIKITSTTSINSYEDRNKRLSRLEQKCTGMSEWPSVSLIGISRNPRMDRSPQGRSFRRASIVMHHLSLFKLVEML